MASSLAASGAKLQKRADRLINQISAATNQRRLGFITSHGKAKELRKRPNAKKDAQKAVGKIFGDPTGKKTEAELEEEFNKKVERAVWPHHPRGLHELLAVRRLSVRVRVGDSP